MTAALMVKQHLGSGLSDRRALLVELDSFDAQIPVGYRTVITLY
jgi:hypothetical protein